MAVRLACASVSRQSQCWHSSPLYTSRHADANAFVLVLVLVLMYATVHALLVLASYLVSSAIPALLCGSAALLVVHVTSACTPLCCVTQAIFKLLNSFIVAFTISSADGGWKGGAFAALLCMAGFGGLQLAEACSCAHGVHGPWRHMALRGVGVLRGSAVVN